MIRVQINRFAELEDLIIDKLLSPAVRDGVDYATDKWKDVKIKGISGPLNGNVMGLDDTDAMRVINVDIEHEKEYE